MNTPSNLPPLRNDQDLTQQEHLFLGGNMDVEVASWHTPLGLVQGNVTKEELLARRGETRYVDNAMTLVGWKTTQGVEGSVIRLALAPLNRDTGESTTDPRILIGDFDPGNGEFRLVRDITDAYVRDRQEKYGVDLHMRTEERKRPEEEGLGHKNREQE